MNRIYSFLLSFAALFFMLFSANSAYAGGGPVEFTLDPNTSLNPGEQYIVHARVYADEPYPTYCKNCSINLAFENPQGSDYIAQNSDRTDDNGTIYAKVISKIPGKRTLIVKDRIIVRPDGVKVTANSSVIVNYNGDSPLPTQPVDLRLIVSGQKYLDGPERMVYLSWTQIPGAVKYNVYARLADTKDYGAALLGTGQPSGDITINAFLDYYVKVNACSEPTVCTSSPEVFVKAMSKDNEVVSTQKQIPTTNTVVNSTNAVVTQAANGDNSKVEELNKKVENLQDQLEVSKQRQNTLEQRINDLVGFIKHLFPFFK